MRGTGLDQAIGKQDVCDKHGEFTSMGFQIGRTMRWPGCPECSRLFAEAQREEQAKSAAEAAQRALEQRLDRSGIPLRYRAKDFASFTAADDKQAKARSMAMEFATNFPEHLARGTFMVMSGQPGT